MLNEFLCGGRGGGWGVGVGVEKPGCDVDYPPPCSAEVKIWWSYSSVDPIYLCGVNKDHCTFAFIIIIIIIIIIIWHNSPPVGQDFLFHEVSRSHTTTHHTR